MENIKNIDKPANGTFIFGMHGSPMCGSMFITELASLACIDRPNMRGSKLNLSANLFFHQCILIREC